MLLLLFSGAAGQPPAEEAFHAVGGKGVRRVPAPRRASSASQTAAYAEALEIQETAEREARDLRDLQEIVAALFTLKGIF